MYVNVTLAYEWCCVTKIDLQGFVWELYEFALRTFTLIVSAHPYCTQKLIHMRAK